MGRGLAPDPAAARADWLRRLTQGEDGEGQLLQSREETVDREMEQNFTSWLPETPSNDDEMYCSFFFSFFFFHIHNM